ncbi:MAG: HD domain-containing protein [Clostridiaceae bacterium]
MNKGAFSSVAANSDNENWNTLIRREYDLYSREDEIRSDFARDYTRILHSLAYRRLKHKTQVFFNIENDHICTRMEHVSHVESVSNTIASYLGLNVELTKAIAIGHDLGHAPFGHQGEQIIKELTEEHLKKKFWHEQNGLRFVDKVELLEDNYNIYRNLDLTYAVRDGIISHCGEVDENGIKPRKELINLSEFRNAGQYQPSTWEGCVVKIADKVAYLGRDIEDAIRLNFLPKENMEFLKQMAKENDENAINTTVIMHNMIIDICNNSTPDKGIYLSKKYLKQINEIKNFNYEHIYLNKRLNPFKNYARLVILEIFTALLEEYKGEETLCKLDRQKEHYPELMGAFSKWLARYCTIDWNQEISQNSKNDKIYGNLETKEIYIQAIIDYISGMTDSYAIKVFNELLAY